MSESKNTPCGGILRARLLVILLASLFSVGAILLLRRAIVGTGPVPLRILCGAGGVLTALAGAFAWLVLMTMLTSLQRNLFLYDRRTRTELPPEKLNWELVRERLDFYFRIYLGGRRAAPIPEPLRPLLMPYFLLTLLESASDGDWDRLLGGDKRLLDELSDGVRFLGLDRFGDALQRAYGTYSGDAEAARRALVPYRAETEAALLGYIRAHLSDYG